MWGVVGMCGRTTHHNMRHTYALHTPQHAPPCPPPQCVSAVDVGGQVDSLLLESGYLFVGLHDNNNQGLIKVWNTSTGQEFVLEGHQVCVWVCVCVCVCVCV